MLVGNYKSIISDDRNFKVAFEWIRSEIWKTLEVGTYQLDGKNVYAMIQSYESKPREKGLFEKHIMYADVQMVISGQEMMYTTQDNLLIGQSEKGYDDSGDIIFFSHYHPKANSIVMDPGLVCVLYPDDAHIPCVAVEEPKPIRKLVVKVAVTK